MARMALNADEKKTLKACEETIGGHVRAFLEVGRALTTIMNLRLYRIGYRDFETYVDERWDLSRNYAYRLMEAASVVDDLLPIGNILPVNESQARPLVSLTTEQRREAWEHWVLPRAETVKSKITASLVEEAVEAYRLEVGLASPKGPGSAGAADVFARIKTAKKALRKMESKPEYEDFCKRIRTQLSELVDEVEKTYAAAMRDYLRAA